MSTSTNERRHLARRRARARSRNAGAVMFIVAVTLGLLAAMGVYGLSATANDIRAAGHMREALQGQKAGEHAFIMTAETYSPAAANGLYQLMKAGPGRGQQTNCRTAAPYTGNVDKRDAEACLRLEPAEMRNIADEGKTGVNSWVKDPFTDKSFGNAANLPVAPAPLGPFVNVEVTNPVEIVVAGNSGQTFAQMTITTFVEIKKAVNVPADTVVAGRGRITVGPVAATTQQF